MLKVRTIKRFITGFMLGSIAFVSSPSHGMQIVSGGIRHVALNLGVQNCHYASMPFTPEELFLGKHTMNSEYTEPSYSKTQIDTTNEKLELENFLKIGSIKSRREDWVYTEPKAEVIPWTNPEVTDDSPLAGELFARLHGSSIGEPWDSGTHCDNDANWNGGKE